LQHSVGRWIEQSLARCYRWRQSRVNQHRARCSAIHLRSTRLFVTKARSS
jgi:hypothetical protein